MLVSFFFRSLPVLSGLIQSIASLCLIFMIILKLPDANHLPGYTSNACSAGRRILQFLFWRIRSPTISVRWGALAQVLILKSKVDHLVRAKAYFALHIMLSAYIQIIVWGKVRKTLKAMTFMNQALTLRSWSNEHPSGYLQYHCWSPLLNKYQPLAKKMTPCFSGRKSCSSITMNQMEPSTLYDLVIHYSSLFPYQDHDFDNCQEALFEHLTIAKARTKLTGWQRAT